MVSRKPLSFEAWKQNLQEHVARKEIYKHGEKVELAFYDAIANGELDKMRFLLEQGLPRLFSASNPLHAAASTDNVETLALLLEWGEDINGCDVFGNSPLSDAVMGGHLRAIAYLLQHGADPAVFSKDQANGSMPVPGTPLLKRAWSHGFGWITAESEHVLRLIAGLACLFDLRSALLSEWKAENERLYAIYKLPHLGRQWCLWVAEALRERGREDLAALLTSESPLP